MIKFIRYDGDFMRIGIDIDDTMTDIKDKLTNAAYEYAKRLGKDIVYDGTDINDIHNDGNIYQKVFGFNYEELKYFLGEIQEDITDNAVPRENCVEVINKLKSEGNEIYVITARDTEFHKDPYKQSKQWLDKNGIKYNKLIVNARNKGNVFKEEKIDILIDDSLSNCISVLNHGIKAIRFGDADENILSCEKWLDVYSIIQKQVGIYED